MLNNEQFEFVISIAPGNINKNRCSIFGFQCLLFLEGSKEQKSEYRTQKSKIIKIFEHFLKISIHFSHKKIAYFGDNLKKATFLIGSNFCGPSPHGVQTEMYKNRGGEAYMSFMWNLRTILHQLTDNCPDIRTQPGTLNSSHLSIYWDTLTDIGQLMA